MTFPPGSGACTDPRGRRTGRGGGCREVRSRAADYGTGEVVRRGPARHKHEQLGVAGLGSRRAWGCVQRAQAASHEGVCVGRRDDRRDLRFAPYHGEDTAEWPLVKSLTNRGIISEPTRAGRDHVELPV